MLCRRLVYSSGVQLWSSCRRLVPCLITTEVQSRRELKSIKTLKIVYKNFHNPGKQAGIGRSGSKVIMMMIIITLIWSRLKSGTASRLPPLFRHFSADNEKLQQMQCCGEQWSGSDIRGHSPSLLVKAVPGRQNIKHIKVKSKH